MQSLVLSRAPWSLHLWPMNFFFKLVTGGGGQLLLAPLLNTALGNQTTLDTRLPYYACMYEVAVTQHTFFPEIRSAVTCVVGLKHLFLMLFSRPHHILLMTVSQFAARTSRQIRETSSFGGGTFWRYADWPTSQNIDLLLLSDVA